MTKSSAEGMTEISKAKIAGKKSLQEVAAILTRFMNQMLVKKRKWQLGKAKIADGDTSDEGMTEISKAKIAGSKKKSTGSSDQSDLLYVSQIAGKKKKMAVEDTSYEDTFDEDTSFGAQIAAGPAQIAAAPAQIAVVTAPKAGKRKRKSSKSRKRLSRKRGRTDYKKTYGVDFKG